MQTFQLFGCSTHTSHASLRARMLVVHALEWRGGIPLRDIIWMETVTRDEQSWLRIEFAELHAAASVAEFVVDPGLAGTQALLEAVYDVRPELRVERGAVPRSPVVSWKATRSWFFSLVAVAGLTAVITVPVFLGGLEGLRPFAGGGELLTLDQLVSAPLDWEDRWLLVEGARLDPDHSAYTIHRPRREGFSESYTTYVPVTVRSWTSGQPIRMVYRVEHSSEEPDWPGETLSVVVRRPNRHRFPASVQQVLSRQGLRFASPVTVLEDARQARSSAIGLLVVGSMMVVLMVLAALWVGYREWKA